MIIQVGIVTFMTLVHFRSWQVPEYLVDKGGQIDSFYPINRYDCPYYSWFHGFNTKIYQQSRTPKFAMLAQGYPLPLSHGDDVTACNLMIYEIGAGKILPQYITFSGSGLDF